MNPPDPARPLVTFLLVTYNQERFVREAVTAAFAQTYSQLEIIFSDDCSPDRTFEIMQEMVAAYRGQHSVTLTRTDKNGGLIANLNSAMALAKGELVVIAAGDDISLPQRVEKLTAEWLRAGKPSGLTSAVHNMDENGKIQSLSGSTTQLNPSWENTPRTKKMLMYARNADFTLTGCAAAWTKEMWNNFGNLMPGVVNEDSVLSFRAILDRGIWFVPEPLVLYRQHANNIWNAILPEEKFTTEYYRRAEITAVRRAPVLAKMFENSLADLKTAEAKMIIDSATARELERELRRSIRRKTLQARWWELSFCQRLRQLAHAPHRRFPLNVTSLLPLDQHAALRSLRMRTKKQILKIFRGQSALLY
jgi:glycosyltransferase involved in cell wall biosynthesis